MQKLISLFIALVVSGYALAGKRRPVRLGHYDHRVTNTNLKRFPLRVPVDVCQEENVLHLDSKGELVFTLRFLDDNNEVIAEMYLVGDCNDVEIPVGATAVVLYVGESAFIGMLY